MTHIDWGYGAHGNHGIICFFPSDYRRLVSVFTATMSVNVHGNHGTHTQLFLRISVPSIRFGYPRPRCFLSILPNWFICKIYPTLVMNDVQSLYDRRSSCIHRLWCTERKNRRLE
jgi:hypothetical protein